MIPLFQLMVPVLPIKTQRRELRYSSGVIQGLSQLGGWGQCVEQMAGGLLILLIWCAHVRWCGRMMYELWSCTIPCKFSPLVSCGTPSFAGRTNVEAFNSTTVGSEIVYQCQSGFLPEGRMTAVCGEDGRWNPHPDTLMCQGKFYCTSYWAVRHCKVN